jgi:hypothetical protein
MGDGAAAWVGSSGSVQVADGAMPVGWGTPPRSPGGMGHERRRSPTSGDGEDGVA